MTLSRLLMRWLPAFVLMLMIFGFSSLPASRIPYLGSLDVVFKKGGHVIGYAMLGLSYFFALPPRLSTGYRRILALLMAVLFALSDEYHQSFVEGRGSTLTDVVIDGSAALVSLLIGTAYLPNSSSNSAS